MCGDSIRRGAGSVSQRGRAQGIWLAGKCGLGSHGIWGACVCACRPHALNSSRHQPYTADSQTQPGQQQQQPAATRPRRAASRRHSPPHCLRTWPPPHLHGVANPHGALLAVPRRKLVADLHREGRGGRGGGRDGQQAGWVGVLCCVCMCVGAGGRGPRVTGHEATVTVIMITRGGARSCHGALRLASLPLLLPFAEAVQRNKTPQLWAISGPHRRALVAADRCV